jgi:hypothetical protein
VSLTPTGFVLREDGAEEYVPVFDRADLELPHLQMLLQRAHYSRTPPVCGCGLMAGKTRLLHVHRLPSGATAPSFTLHAKAREEHADGCWLRGEDDFGQVCSAQVFAPRPEFPHRMDTDSGATAEAITRQHRRFSRFASQLVAGAQREAFCLRNASWRRNGFTQPGAPELFAAMERELSRPRFAAVSARMVAAAAGCSLGVGVIVGDVAPCSGARERVECFQWWSPGRLTSSTHVMRSDLWHEALRSVKAMGALQSAPYLFVAAVEPSGRIRYLRLFSSYTDGHSLTTCDSAFEAAFAGHLRRKGCAFLKPILREDTEALFRALALDGLENLATIYYRPDYLVFENKAGNWRCYVVELRGFAPGKIPAYDAHLATKARFFGELAPGKIVPIERDGSHYHVVQYDPFNLQWVGLRLDWGGESEAAHASRQGLVTTVPSACDPLGRVGTHISGSSR